MLIPTKHENLSLNVLVLGADLLKAMKGQLHNVESLFAEIRLQKELTIDIYFDVLAFLWLSDLIEIDERTYVRRKK